MRRLNRRQYFIRRPFLTLKDTCTNKYYKQMIKEGKSYSQILNVLYTLTHENSIHTDT
jgi:hypothetical protein